MDTSSVVPEFADTGVGMWVGELWSYTQVLCDPKGLPDQMPMQPPEGYRERVVLILDRDGEELEGRIAFGVGDLSGASGYVPGQHDPFVGCSNYRPAIGGTYDVRSVVQRQGRLTFEIAPNEIWNDWCRREPFVCEPLSCLGVRGCICDGEVCRADLTQRLLIDLTARPDELEGIVSLGLPSSELRLRRVQ